MSWWVTCLVSIILLNKTSWTGIDNIGFPTEDHHYGTAVSTRASAQKELQKLTDNPPSVDIPITPQVTVPADNTFVTEQEVNASLLSSLNKINKPPIKCKAGTVSFIKHNNIALEFFFPSKNDVNVKKILLPKSIEMRHHLAHDVPMSAHLATKKTIDRVKRHFFLAWYD